MPNPPCDRRWHPPASGGHRSRHRRPHNATDAFDAGTDAGRDARAEAKENMEMKPMKTIKHKAFFDGMMVKNASRVGNALYWHNEQMYECFDAFAFKQQDPAVLLDYIGFEDANDTEIYECDILHDDWNRRLLVKWIKGGFRFKAITETNFTHAQVYEWFEFHVGSLVPRPEIIGNAFENPELLILSKCCNATITIGDCASECDECGMSVNPDTGESYNVKTSQIGGLKI